MSICLEVIVHAERLPSAQQVAAAVNAVEPGFALSEPFDLANDNGWCPCSLGSEDCGFEWSLEAEGLADPWLQQGFTHAARLEYRSSEFDARCAIRFAAELAQLCGGAVVDPAGTVVPAAEARAWAERSVAALARPKPARRAAHRKKQPPGPLRLAGSDGITRIRLYCQARQLPDAEWLERGVSSMDRRFSFDGAFDFAEQSGRWPCRLGELRCGFDWSIAVADAVPATMAREGFDHVAEISWGLSEADGTCAALVAANLASITGGTLVLPDGEEIGFFSALEWASLLVRGLRRR